MPPWFCCGAPTVTRGAGFRDQLPCRQMLTTPTQWQLGRGGTVARILGRSLLKPAALADVALPEPAQCGDARSELERYEAERLRSLVQLSFDVGALVDAAGTINFVSPAYERIFGFSPEEVVGRAAWDMLFVEKDVEYAQRFLSELLRSHDPMPSRRYSVRHRDGSPRTVEIRAINRLADPLCRAIVVNLRDVTDEELSKHATEIATGQLDSLLSQSQLRVGILDHQGRFVRVTQTVADAHGLSVEGHVGRHPRDVAPALWSQIESAFQSVVKSQQPQTITILEGSPSPRGAARSRTLRIHLFPIALSDDEVGVAGITDDISAEVDREAFEAGALKGAVAAVANAAEWRDPYTAGHQRRVASLSEAIAARLLMDPHEIEGIRIAAGIHDIGKLSIPAEILAKPMRLNPAEMALVEMHAQVGYEIVKGIEFPWPVPEMILQHHERLDGSGYPNHLVGKDIVRGAKIIAVADTVEAMTSHRPYRPGRPLADAIAVISDATKYEPEIVEACIGSLSDQQFTLTGWHSNGTSETT